MASSWVPWLFGPKPTDGYSASDVPESSTLITSTPDSSRGKKRSRIDYNSEDRGGKRAASESTKAVNAAADMPTSLNQTASFFETLFSPVYRLVVGRLQRGEDHALPVINGEIHVSGEGSAVVSDTKPVTEELPTNDTENGGDEDEEAGDHEDGLYEFDPWEFIREIPPLAEVENGRYANRDPVLPKRVRGGKRLTLVLDLDETLVHCDICEMSGYDTKFNVSLNERVHVVYMRKRPHMLEFLKRVSKLYEVVLFTASQKIYADTLLNLFDSERKLIHHRLFREHCAYVEGNYVKDLHILGRNLKHTMIVDNSPQAFAYQLSNGIPIETWRDDKDDTELLKLLPFLEDLAARTKNGTMSDVRPMIEKRYKIRERVDGQ